MRVNVAWINQIYVPTFDLLFYEFDSITRRYARNVVSYVRGRGCSEGQQKDMRICNGNAIKCASVMVWSSCSLGFVHQRKYYRCIRIIECEASLKLLWCSYKSCKNRSWLNFVVAIKREMSVLTSSWGDSFRNNAFKEKCKIKLLCRFSMILFVFMSNEQYCLERGQNVFLIGYQIG